MPDRPGDDVLRALEHALARLVNGPGSTLLRSRPTDGFSAITSVLLMGPGA